MISKPLQVVLLTAGLVAAGRDLAAQPPAGSHLPPDDNSCAKCHGDDGLWEGDTLRLYVPQKSLAQDVHFLKGVNCHDCHGGDPSSFDVPQAHATEVEKGEKRVLPFRSPLTQVWNSCGNCHKEERLSLDVSAHAKAGSKDKQGQGTPLPCGACHGEKAHGILPVRDSRSPVSPEKQVHLCGSCHQESQETYLRSVHGHGLEKSGLLVTAVCAKCHGAHGVYPKSDPRSTLSRGSVAGTCGKCHRFIEERLQKSVHGRHKGSGGAAEEPAAGGRTHQEPTCTDCHQGHDLANPSSVRFHSALPDRCGNCHTDLSGRYGLSMHGELTELGYGPAANCSDCHGSHSIVPVSDPASPVSAASRGETCRECHPYATANFLEFDPHADHRDPARNPLLHWVYVVLMTFLFSTIGLFAVHSLIWFVRGMIHTTKHGRPRALVPGERAFVRFRPMHRVAHTVMVISFLGLALTGLPLKYSDYTWAHNVAFWLGGFGSTSIWHRIFGVVNIGCLVLYVFMMLGRVVGPSPRVSRWNVLFGPDSPVFVRRDLWDLGKMLRWFFGLGPKPTFERWAYWEKVDFWGACADIVIIGVTGLMLWFPNLFCSFLPGESLNIAKLVHSTQALLATAFVFSIHFFAVLFRPEKFPMDLSVLTGLVSEEEMQEERPEYLARLRSYGKLDELTDVVPPRRVLRLIRFAGFVAMAIGLALLAAIILAAVGG